MLRPWWKLNVPKSRELIGGSRFPPERGRQPGVHPRSSGGQRGRRSGRAAPAFAAPPTAPGSGEAKWSAHANAQWHFQMQLSWGPLLYCISGTSREKEKKKKEIHNFVKVVDGDLPPSLLQNHHRHALIALIDTDFMHISVTAVFLMHVWKGP